MQPCMPPCMHAAAAAVGMPPQCGPSPTAPWVSHLAFGVASRIVTTPEPGMAFLMGLAAASPADGKVGSHSALDGAAVVPRLVWPTGGRQPPAAGPKEPCLSPALRCAPAVGLRLPSPAMHTASSRAADSLPTITARTPIAPGRPRSAAAPSQRLLGVLHE